MEGRVGDEAGEGMGGGAGAFGGGLWGPSQESELVH
jgi:hypothetical protein